MHKLEIEKAIVSLRLHLCFFWLICIVVVRKSKKNYEDEVSDKGDCAEGCLGLRLSQVFQALLTTLASPIELISYLGSLDFMIIESGEPHFAIWLLLLSSFLHTLLWSIGVLYKLRHHLLSISFHLPSVRLPLISRCYIFIVMIVRSFLHSDSLTCYWFIIVVIIGSLPCNSLFLHSDSLTYYWLIVIIIGSLPSDSLLPGPIIILLLFCLLSKQLLLFSSLPHPLRSCLSKLCK